MSAHWDGYREGGAEARAELARLRAQLREARGWVLNAVDPVAVGPDVKQQMLDKLAQASSEDGPATSRGEDSPVSASMPNLCAAEAEPDRGSLMANRLSAWVDAGLAGKPSEAILWHRVGKVGEECGEVVEALIGATDGNPRKLGSHTLDDVRKELLDTALAALCAWAHLAGNEGDPFGALADHTAKVHAWAGLSTIEGAGS